MPFANVNDTTLFYEMQGEGSPLFLINGFAQNCTSWQEIAPKFAEKFQVIIFDNRGSGQSDSPVMPYSMKMLAEDTVALMDELNIPSAHFFGQSMGSAITLQICHDHSDRVKKAVLCVPFAYLPEVTKQQFHTVDRLVDEGMDRKTMMELHIPWLFSNHFFKTPGAKEQFIQDYLKDPYPQTPAGFQGQIDALFDFDARGWLDKIPHELLLLIGDQDILTPPYVSEEIFQRAPNCKKEIFKQTAHMLEFEQTEKVLKSSIKFFSLVV